jgi:hypothetical protein
MYSFDNKEYTYHFTAGLNYFRGRNSSGKTEFYNFLDFMFGSSEDIRNKSWYRDTLKKATMEVQVGDITYILTRFDDPSRNYLYYAGEKEKEILDLREYKNRLNAIFARDTELLKRIRDFTDEELTYRTFTIFNFLGEKRQGIIHDFFDKCSNIKYSVKLAPILNFIFNSNLEKIYLLQKELEKLQDELRKAEMAYSRYDFICKQVNKNIEKLGSNVWFDGKNVEDIRKNIADIKNMEEPKKKGKDRNISELEVMYNNLSEQIKVYENSISDAKQFENENINRKKLLESLEHLIAENASFKYLVEPLKQLVNELDSTISFNQYTINDKTILELKKQRNMIKEAIKRNDSRFQCYIMEEKAKSIAIIEDYLSADIHDSSEELKKLKKEIREKKDQIKILQNSDDVVKTRELSKFITMLYKSAEGISSVVDNDILQEGFRIQYFKRGNILQPMVEVNETDENGLKQKKEVNWYTGSLARHTLIQLCGYLGFLKILLSEERYPIIPILAIDHISKPFDKKNALAIGQIINKAYESIGKENLQIFMFDDEEYAVLALEPEHSEDLVNKVKTGFNPFYYVMLEQQ